MLNHFGFQTLQTLPMILSVCIIPIYYQLDNQHLHWQQPTQLAHKEETVFQLGMLITMNMDKMRIPVLTD